MAGIERGIGEVFVALEDWLVTSGATAAMMRLAWAVLTVLWLGYVAVSVRPGRYPDLIDVFGRLAVAGGLLTAMGALTRIITIGFETLRGAGAAVLNGLIGESWSQFVQGWLTPQLSTTFNLVAPWFAYPWAMPLLGAGLVLGILLFALGVMVYLAILFFAHLTLLLAIFLAPLAVALLATPSTQRWTARWAAVIVRTGLVVFSVRVIHAAVLYLAVIVPVRELASGMQRGFPWGDLPSTGATDWLARGAGMLTVYLRLGWFLFLMLVGTGIGIYAMLRAERLTGQFVDGVAFGEHVFGGPWWAGRELAHWYARSGGDIAARGAIGGGEGQTLAAVLSTGASGTGAGGTGAGGMGGGGIGGSGAGGGAQEATVMKPGGRFS